jgi:hypothetical protein
MPRAYGKNIKPILRVIGPSIAYVELSRGLFSVIEADDIESVEQFNWCASSHSGKFYVVRRIPPNSQQYLHRFLFGEEISQIDHINGRTLDNRRNGNLRLATSPQNCWNRQKPSNNKSGYKGVYWDKRGGCWIAQIRAAPKTRRLGSFGTPEEAAAVYQDAALILHGEFAKW